MQSDDKLRDTHKQFVRCYRDGAIHFEELCRFLLSDACDGARFEFIDSIPDDVTQEFYQWICEIDDSLPETRGYISFLNPETPE